MTDMIFALHLLMSRSGMEFPLPKGDCRFHRSSGIQGQSPRLDPDYETSDDRKALLREVAERRVNDYQIDYATNALKRIDAKIQAERKGD